mgnify:CR=1 FL=1
MIVLRTPKGWTGPREVDGKVTEGTWRSHQVPLSGVKDDPEHLLRMLEGFAEHGTFEFVGPLADSIQPNSTAPPLK